MKKKTIRQLVLLSILFSLFVYINYPIYSFHDGEKFKTPEDLCIFMMEKLKYIPEIDDHWQVPEETLSKGGGDCEDFAILAYYALKKMNIKSNIYILVDLKEKDCNHAICVFKYKEGYCCFDNQYLRKSKITDIKIFLKKAFPDYDIAINTNSRKLLRGYIFLLWSIICDDVDCSIPNNNTSRYFCVAKI